MGRRSPYKLCEHRFVCHLTHTMSNLWDHLERKHNELQRKSKGSSCDEGQTRLKSYFAPAKKTETLTPEQSARLAKRYLAVPGTSVPSERVLSTSGLIVNDLRSRLSPAIVDALVFANRNTLALARPSAPAAVEKTQEKQDVVAVEDDCDSENEIPNP